ncbi:MAG: hypothetical protein AAF902_24510 [Chloroflexota bacterium]
MSALSFNTAQGEPENFWRKGWNENGPLRWSIIFAIALLIGTIVGLIVDPRTVIGEPVWLKPAKFAMSTAVYSASMMWVLAMIDDWPRTVKIVSWVTAVGFIIELILISFQAFRGVRSHFNTSTPLDATIFGIMGSAILIVWLVSILALVALWRTPFKNRAWGIILRWSLILTIIGSGLGGTMTSPNETQLEAARAGEGLPESGAHTVGAPDGGEGLPGVGWSTEGGDLRIGHFLGLHALQILPIVGLAVLWLFGNRSEWQQVSLIHLAAVGYLGIIALLTWQAFRAEPLIYPSTLTLTVTGIFFAALFGLVGLVLARPMSS